MLLLASALVNMIGSTMTLVAIPLIVLSVTRSPLALGVVSAAETAAVVVGMFLSGPLIDRVGPRRMAIWSSLLAGAVLAAIPITASLGEMEIWTLAVVGAAAALAASPGLTCRQMLLGAAATTAGVGQARAGSVYWIFPRLGMVIGGPLAVALLASLGNTAVIWLDVASFVISAALILGVAGARPSMSGQQASSSYMRDLAEGLQAVWSIRAVRLMTITAFVLSAFDAPRISVIAPVYLSRVGAPSTVLAWVVGIYTAGSLAGLVLYTLFLPRLSIRWVLAGCLTATGCAYLLLAAAPGIPAALIGMMLAGIAQGPFLPIMIQIVNENTVPHVRGRVLGAIMAAVSVALPLGNLTFGAALEAVPLWIALGATAAAYLGAAWPVARIASRSEDPKPELAPPAV